MDCAERQDLANMNDPDQLPLDFIPPDKIARLVEQVGMRKVGLAFLPTLTLAVLAGAFIAFGAMASTVAMTDSALGFGPTRLLAGATFSLGLILVIIGGAELFTGNSLIVMAWVGGRVSTGAILRNWTIVYAGNLVGAVATAILVHLSGIFSLAEGALGATAEDILLAKLAISPFAAFWRGILCNVLVCLAVWMSFAARGVAGKVMVIVPPVTAFVMLGFEHSVANMYLLPVAMLYKTGTVDVLALLANLAPVTAGNIVGGGGLVALVYWLIYLRTVPADGPI
jgi:formate transporter